MVNGSVALEIELAKTLLQMGAAGILCVAGWYMMRFLAEERKDRASERQMWFDHLDSLTRKISEAIDELRRAGGSRCPFTGVSLDDILSCSDVIRRKSKSSGE